MEKAWRRYGKRRIRLQALHGNVEWRHACCENRLPTTPLRPGFLTGKRNGEDNGYGHPRGSHRADERSVGRGVTWWKLWTSTKTGAAVISLAGLGLADVP